MKANILGALFLLVLVAVIVWMIGTGSTKPVDLTAGSAGGGQLVLMDFYATWCGPCMMMKPVVHELAGELQGRVSVLEINVDENPDLARQYNVRSIPCFVVTRDGKEVNRAVGSMPKANLRLLTGM